MPKEITHWKIIDAAAESLKGSAAGELIAAHINCARVGAVFHDCLYYQPWLLTSHPVHVIPERLHGKEGADTYGIINNILRGFEKREAYDNGTAAFLIGIYAHIAADKVFHPFVNYFTGDGSEGIKTTAPRTRRAHRRFECVLDLAFCKDPGETGNYSLKKYLRDLETPLEKLLDYITMFNDVVSRRVLVKKITSSYKIFSILQNFDKYRFLFGIAYPLERLMPGWLTQVNALFYAPQLYPYTDKLRGVIAFRNPHSGEHFEKTIDELFLEAVNDTLWFCRVLEKAMQDGCFITLEKRGPSLVTGLDADSRDKAEYFSEKPFFPGLSP